MANDLSGSGSGFETQADAADQGRIRVWIEPDQKRP